MSLNSSLLTRRRLTSSNDEQDLTGQEGADLKADKRARLCECAGDLRESEFMYSSIVVHRWIRDRGQCHNVTKKYALRVCV